MFILFQGLSTRWNIFRAQSTSQPSFSAQKKGRWRLTIYILKSVQNQAVRFIHRKYTTTGIALLKGKLRLHSF